ncbi:biotin/lipoyl-containing protein, partial [Thiococcus pfennigii]|uniref:biotin/lipoyl-containing protein n=1 Tax=Thiococcus pfennigii TaxID=1057 RepID=UPI001F5BA89C
MTQTIEVKLPDIGGFKDVSVIELLVAPGDRIEAETSLITLESDKATMEIPSPHAGTVKALAVKVGDRISAGDPILTLEADEAASGAGDDAPTASPTTTREPSATPAAGPNAADEAETREILAEVAVLGAGPGGYTAAF